MNARDAHTAGFSDGTTYACAHAGDDALDAIRAGDAVVPSYRLVPSGVRADYEEGFREALEYVDNAGEAFDGIGSTDGVTYDECVHRSRYI